MNKVNIEGKIDAIDEILQSSFTIVFNDKRGEEVFICCLSIAYDEKFKDIIKEGNIVRIVGQIGCDPDGENIIYPEHIEKVNN